MNKSITHALGLTLLLLFSGCIGPFSSESSETEVIEDKSPVLEFYSVNDVIWGNSVLLSGKVNDELLQDVTIIITVSIVSLEVYEKPDGQGYWEFIIEDLEPGNYSVTVTALDKAEKQSESLTKEFTILLPDEDDATLTIWRKQIWFESGDEVQITGQLEHNFIESCSLNGGIIWGDNVIGNNTARINFSSDVIFFDSNSGSFHIILTPEQNFTALVIANCGLYTLSVVSTNVSGNILDELVADADDDGIPDDFDSCPNGDSIRLPTMDYDSDGCKDATEDNDDDNDGVQDIDDNCEKGELGWFSNPINDKDGDGCRDDSEDDDDDGDGVIDLDDDCLDSPYGWTSSFVSDYDRDGCRDSDFDLDDDNDGIQDVNDLCPKGVIGWFPSSINDRDSDGCRDSDEDLDDDNDSVLDSNDTCPETIIGFSVNEFGCAEYEWDSDNDGVMDDVDQCEGTPNGLLVNEQGCADLDGDGVYANVDVCPNSPNRWSVDVDGCAVIQHPVSWSTGSYSNSRFGKASDFSFNTKFDGNWRFSIQWDGNSTYLFIFLQSSSSYMSSIWNQNVGTLLSEVPENCHIFFGSYDSDWQSDVDAMANRVNSYRNTQNEEGKLWVDDNVHFVYQQAGSIGGGLGSVISSWSQFYYGIDRFQQWREIGSLYNWARSWSSEPEYRFDYLAKEPQMWNAEYPVEMRKHDSAITVVDLWQSQRHSGGWGSGHKSFANGTFPNSTTMLSFNTMEVYMHHGCSERRDRYQKSDGTWGGCHEWDYDQRLNICQEVGNHSTCGDEFVRYITTYGREGRWLTDISTYLFMVQGGGLQEFRYGGANGGWLNISVYLSTWDDDGLRPTSAEYAFSGGTFRGEYNNQSQYKRIHNLSIPSGTDKVVISSVVTGHGFGKDDANCAEFCNHEHRFSMNGFVTQEDHPMAGNSTVSSDREGCAKETHAGTVANQKGSWPYGRAGWCAGQDTKPWVWDITNWVDWSGGSNLMQYQGLYDGVNYIPQNEQSSGTNQDIRVTSYIVYYTNISNINISIQMFTDEPYSPLQNDSNGEIILSPQIEAWLRDDYFLSSIDD